MNLYLRCDGTDPPTGRLRRLRRSDVTPPAEQADSADHAPCESVEFSGWLGLLRALSDVFDDTADEHAPHRPS